jgi:hypothetical protein
MTFLFDTTNEINKATTTSTVEHERSFNDEMEFSELNTQTQKQTQKKHKNKHKNKRPPTLFNITFRNNSTRKNMIMRRL